MNVEQSSVEVRVAKHAALADPVRLAVVDLLHLGDASPSELQSELGVSSNLLAHHLGVLEQAGIAVRRRSQGDRRRSYVTLVPGGLEFFASGSHLAALDHAQRVVFVCTANSARSQLATALWQRVSTLPSASAGTHPAAKVATGAVRAARRRGLDLGAQAPQHLDQVLREGDVLITVCDNAHEELDGRDTVHWAIPDPVAQDTAAAYDAAVTDLTRRITHLANAS